jgi:hypothetical protein
VEPLIKSLFRGKSSSDFVTCGNSLGFAHHEKIGSAAYSFGNTVHQKFPSKSLAEQPRKSADCARFKGE